MKKVVCLFLVLMFLSSSVAFADAFGFMKPITLVVENGDSVSICGRQMYIIEVLVEGEEDSVKDILWTTSDDDITHIYPDGRIFGVGIGSATLKGKTADESVTNIKINITIPKVYTTSDSIIIDTPDGVEFGSAFSVSGYLSVSHSGNCFRSDPMEDIGGINMSKLMPVEVGKGSITFKANGKTLKTVKVEVKHSAFEPIPTPTVESEETLEIVLAYPELGEYGRYHTFNEDTDAETIVQYFVPAGVYTVTNVDRSPWTFVYTYSNETQITNAGWEEPAESWVSPMLKVGESCEVTIPEGWYIELQEKDHLKLVQNN